jgi:GTPase Era involved in 16S rRNA processing
MSSGKSTLINALVGRDLLPSQNRACTARAIAIMDNDMLDQFRIHAVDKNGEYTLIENATKRAVQEYNSINETSEMIIEGQIKGVRTSIKSMMIVDTPGINNSMDQSHELITKSVLDDYLEGLILYIINAQQIGTYDDSNFLTLIAKKIKENQNFHIIFVVNKMDLIDPIKENPNELISNCKQYIQSKGIDNPILVPVSSESALIFKKVLNKTELSELEEENFARNYKHFKREGLSLLDYVSIPERGDINEKFVIDGVEYTRASIYAALDNTGLPYLESVIDASLVYSLKMKAPRITKKQSILKKDNNKQKTKKTIKKRSSNKRNGRK